MKEYLIEVSNVLLSFYSAHIIVLFPMWLTLGWRKRRTFIYLAALTLYICAGYYIASTFFQLDFRLLQIFKVCITMPTLVVAVWLFRRRLWQIIFLISLAFMYGLIGTGLGSYAMVYWFADFVYPSLAASAVILATAGLILPLLLRALRRLCTNPSIRHDSIWKLIWLLPLAFFALTLLTGSSFILPAMEGSGFFIIRLLICAALLLTCYLLESSLRHVAENMRLAEQARMAENLLAIQQAQYAQLMENAEAVKAMRHDLRHHIAALAQLAEAADTGHIKAYIENLSGTLAAYREKYYCKNQAVNAIAAHYLSLAEAEEISVDAHLAVPEDTGTVPAMDLCIILGNF